MSTSTTPPPPGPPARCRGPARGTLQARLQPLRGPPSSGAVPKGSPPRSLRPGEGGFSLQARLAGPSRPILSASSKSATQRGRRRSWARSTMAGSLVWRLAFPAHGAGYEGPQPGRDHPLEIAGAVPVLQEGVQQAHGPSAPADCTTDVPQGTDFSGLSASSQAWQGVASPAGLEPATPGFIPLRLSPPPRGVRGLDYPFTVSLQVRPHALRCRPSSLYTFPAWRSGLGSGSA